MLKDRLWLLRILHHQATGHEKADDETASQTSAPKEGRGVDGDDPWQSQGRNQYQSKQENQADWL